MESLSSVVPATFERQMSFELIGSQSSDWKGSGRLRFEPRWKNFRAETGSVHLSGNFFQPMTCGGNNRAERGRTIDCVDVHGFGPDPLDRRQPFAHGAVAGVVHSAGGIGDEHRLHYDVRKIADAGAGLVTVNRDPLCGHSDSFRVAMPTAIRVLPGNRARVPGDDSSLPEIRHRKAGPRDRVRNEVRATAR